MKVKELVEELRKTDLNNEVRIEFNNMYKKVFYLSFDVIGDVLIREEKQ